MYIYIPTQYYQQYYNSSTPYYNTYIHVLNVYKIISPHSITSAEYNKSVLTDHALQENHVINWDHALQENHVINWADASVIDRESDRPTRWIKEATSREP